MGTIFLAVDLVRWYHDEALGFGGAVGLRSEQLLASAVFQPQQSAFGEDAYPTIAEKAAAYGYFIVENHPFVDVVPVQQFGRRAQVGLGRDVVAVEDRARPVPARFHRDDFGDPGAHQIADRGAAEVVEQAAGHLGCSAGGAPRPIEVADSLSVPVGARARRSFRWRPRAACARRAGRPARNPESCSTAWT